MKRRHIEETRDFVARQYADLIDRGLDEETARLRLDEVLGEGAANMLVPDESEDNEKPASIVHALIRLGHKMDGDPASVRAAFVHSSGEARLFALDWWRPIRTFLLYILLLLALAVLLVAYYLVNLLPKFVHFSEMMHVHNGGAAGWIMSGHGWRLIAPLAIVALLMLLFFAIMFFVRLRLAGLRPLPGAGRWPLLYGRSGAAYRTLLYLEYASVLLQGRVLASDALSAAQKLIGWNGKRTLRSGKVPVNTRLEQAVELGTLENELDWQRRVVWSKAQSCLELSRDRLILFSRVVFYLLIGYLVAVLYLPIFTLAMSFRRLW